MHAISSYRGNSPQTHTNTHKTRRQDQLQYTAPLSLARSVKIEFKELTLSVSTHYAALLQLTDTESTRIK